MPMQNNNNPSRVLIVGFGCVGQALLPLLLREFSLSPEQIRLIAADAQGVDIANAYRVALDVVTLTRDNLTSTLTSAFTPGLNAGDWLINLSVDVSSIALIQWCKAHGVLYLDTCVEPWAGGYTSDANGDRLHDTTNFALRAQALRLHEDGAPTAVIAHGANPGLITHLANAGLQALAALRGITPGASSAATAAALGIKVIQIAERDTQWVADEVKPHATDDTFVNTWSVSGFLAEAQQCAETGWGTHERTLPVDGMRHRAGDAASIYLRRRGVDVRVKSWVPSVGEQTAYLIAHHEATSLAEHLSVRGVDDATPAYRPTVYYAYRPAPAASRAIERWKANGRREPAQKAFLRDTLTGGFDELGVLFVGDWGAYWYGSTLRLADARAIAPHNSATTLQVVAGMLGALRWMQRHPNAGVVEAEDMDSTEVLADAMPYLGDIGDVGGVLTDWTPCVGSSFQFEDFLVEDVPSKCEAWLEEAVS